MSPQENQSHSSHLENQPQEDGLDDRKQDLVVGKDGDDVVEQGTHSTGEDAQVSASGLMSEALGEQGTHSTGGNIKASATGLKAETLGEQGTHSTGSAVVVDDAGRTAMIHRILAAVPYPVMVAGIWATLFIIGYIALSMFSKVVMAMTSVLVPLGIALMLALPLVNVTNLFIRLTRLPRFVGALFSVLFFTGAFLTIVGYAGAEVAASFNNIGQVAETGSTQIAKYFKDVPGLGDLSAQFPQLYKSAVTYVQTNWQTITKTATSSAFVVGTSIAGFTAGLVIVLISVVFFLSDGDTIWRWCVRLLPRAAEEPTYQAFRRGARSIQAYSQAMVLVALFDATILFITVKLLNLPLGIPLAVMMFIAGFIPMVGVFLATIVSTLVALGASGPTAALIMLTVMLITSQIEGNVLQPLLLGSSVSLHPFAIIIGLAVATYQAGMLGSFFIVPIMALINSVMRYYLGDDPFPDMADPDIRLHKDEDSLV